MNTLIKALHDPSSIYQHPMHVVEDNNLTRDQKIQILRQWEYDTHELEVADEENMLPAFEKLTPGIFQSQVLEALHCLGEQSMGLDKSMVKKAA